MFGTSEPDARLKIDALNKRYQPALRGEWLRVGAVYLKMKLHPAFNEVDWCRLRRDLWSESASFCRRRECVYGTLDGEGIFDPVPFNGRAGISPNQLRGIQRMGLQVKAYRHGEFERFLRWFIGWAEETETRLICDVCQGRFYPSYPGFFLSGVLLSADREIAACPACQERVGKVAHDKQVPEDAALVLVLANQLYKETRHATRKFTGTVPGRPKRPSGPGNIGL